MVGDGFPEDFVEEGEKVLWTGRPKFWPFILKKLPTAAVLVAFAALPLLMVSAAPPAMFEVPFVLLFFALWYGLLAIPFLGVTVYPLLLWRNVRYAVTTKKIIARRGVVGIDYDVLNLDLVQQVNINVSVIDKLCGSGTVVVQAVGVSPLALESVESPLAVREVISRAAEEAKRRL